MITTKLLREKSKAARKAIKQDEAEALAKMTRQEREIYTMNQNHAERLRPPPKDRNVRYDD